MSTQQCVNKIAVFVLVLTLSTPMLASVKPAVIFCNNMVLQRGKEVPVWGEALKGEVVTVSFAGQEMSTTADDAGQWVVKLSAMEANATPSEMIIKSDKDTTDIVITNILIGDVWFCSGQSNMAFGMSGAKDFEKDKVSANYPLIRYNASRTWIVCSPESVAKFSAVAYYFGRDIHETLKIPVGLMVRAVGGTPVEKWAPKDKLLKLDFAREIYDAMREKRIQRLRFIQKKVFLLHHSGLTIGLLNKCDYMYVFAQLEC